MPTKAKKKVNIRHKKILQKMVENGGKGMNMPKAMREVGYSEAYIRSNKIKDTESWGSLVNEVLSDQKLVDIHNRLLNKEEILLRDNKQVRTGQLHSDAKFALDMAYKLKKKYGDITIQHKFGELTDQELETELATTFSALEGLDSREETQSSK